MPEDTTNPPFAPTTFEDCFSQEFKKHYAYRLEKETGHRTELDVTVETIIESDNARIQTTADIVLYNANGPHSVVGFIVTPQNTPSPPSTEDLACIHAQMDALATNNDHPPAVILSIGLNGNTLQRYPLEFDTANWDNLYKYLLADAGTTQAD